MKPETRQRKHTTTVLKALRGQEWLAGHIVQILETGKESLDRFLLELGGMVAETIMLLEREDLAGSDYCPKILGPCQALRGTGSVPGSFCHMTRWVPHLMPGSFGSIAILVEQGDHPSCS